MFAAARGGEEIRSGDGTGKYWVDCDYSLLLQRHDWLIVIPFFSMLPWGARALEEIVW